MGKKCIVCGKEAQFMIKETSNYYCEECAEENFADVSLLMKVEGEAQRLKEVIREAMEETPEEK